MEALLHPIHEVDATGLEGGVLGQRLVGLLEIASIGTVWLVFFPPAFYRNWINKVATVADAAGEGPPDGD